jgi:hypothetical protein
MISPAWRRTRCSWKKRDFIRAHNMVVFNLHDHLRDAMPDRIAAGMAQALGWQSDSANINLFRRPPTTLLALAQELGASWTIRVCAWSAIPRSLSLPSPPASATPSRCRASLCLNSSIDVLVCGYAREWEVVEYCQDMISAGVKKAVVLLGENASVQAGMKFSADWIETVVTEVPVTFIPLPRALLDSLVGLRAAGSLNRPCAASAKAAIIPPACILPNSIKGFVTCCS